MSPGLRGTGEKTAWILILPQWLSVPLNDVSISLKAQRLYCQLRSYADPNSCCIRFLADGPWGSRPPLNLVLMLSLTLSVNGLLPALTPRIGTDVWLVMVPYQM